jgi:hypothetical protein
MLGGSASEAPSFDRHLADHFESTGVLESGMLVSVHPAVSMKECGFSDFQSLRTSPGEHAPIEASQ